jgi:ribosomal protein S18 acetylase RimI-like enzyme
LHGKDIGYALIIHKTVSPTNPFHQPDYASFHIDQMSVDEEYQGKGIGSQLFEFIKQLSQEKGVKRIQLDVWADNEQAKAFYAKLGFEQTRMELQYKLD